MTVQEDRRVVGHRLPRIDAGGKVTGRQVYATDFSLPGMLYGKVFRSTVPHARILRIDTAKASRVPGVRAVMTGADVPMIRFGQPVKDVTVLATDRVRYVGHPVALVAAVTLEAAERALELIDVDYEPLAAVFDSEAAMAAGAPQVHPEWATYKARCRSSRGRGNVAGRARITTATSMPRSPARTASTSTASPPRCSIPATWSLARRWPRWTAVAA